MDSAKGPTEWGEGRHGVGPWQGPWPEDPRYDPEFLEHGDRRNVVDAYRYLSLEAIRAELDKRRTTGGLTPEQHAEIERIPEYLELTRARWSSAVTLWREFRDELRKEGRR